MHTVTISTLEQLEQLEMNVIVLDGLTLACALRAIRGFDLNQPPPAYQQFIKEDHSFQKSRSGGGRKWDYTFSNALRFVIDIMSLAQVIEALVCFDGIAVDVSHINRWGMIHQCSATEIELPGIAGSLSPFIVPFTLTSHERLTLLHYATDQVYYGIENGLLQTLFQLLFHSGSDGALLSMSDAYFRTGYSDTSLFPDICHGGNGLLWAWRMTFGAGTEDLPEPSVVRQIMNDETTLVLWDSLVQSIERLLDPTYAESFIAHQEIGSNDIHGKKMAIDNVMRNAVAAYFHSAIAMQSGLPYLPHIMRSYFMLCRDDQTEISLPPIPQKKSLTHRILARLDLLRNQRVHPINAFYEGQAVDLHLPFLLAMLLRDVDRPADIFDAALVLRDTPQARAFRSWTAELDAKVATGQLSIDKLSSEIDNIDTLLKRWVGVAGPNTTTVEWSIAMGPLGLTIPMQWSPMFSQKRAHHLRFIQRLAQFSTATPQCEPHIRKIFGQEYGDMWRDCHHVITRFQYPNIRQLGQRRRSKDLIP